ncbi:MAG: hypothetical protein VXZ34_00930, partial [Candidatus Thermoplasmatota archaeon]|nr:hypothetical protein [Candidatus Thermoplasmatota archaeon]
MDEETQASTTAFHTLDAFNGDLAAEVMVSVEQAMEGDGGPWSNLVSNRPELRERLVQQGINEPTTFTSIRWDPAMLLFTTCAELTSDGRPLPLGETMTRERFGRFPYGDGSALAYLLEFIRPNRSITDHDGQSLYDELINALEQLAHGCEEVQRGHDRFENGFGGMQIHGFLRAEEVRQLRKNLAGRAWTASYGEPLDGGVADIAKHFTTLL